MGAEEQTSGMDGGFETSSDGVGKMNDCENVVGDSEQVLKNMADTRDLSPNSLHILSNSTETEASSHWLLSSSFQPTLAIEEKVVKAFKKKLESLVTDTFVISAIQDFHLYLKYVLLIADKDRKFICHYITSSDQLVYPNLTSIIS